MTWRYKSPSDLSGQTMTSNNPTDVPLTLEDLSPRQVAETHYQAIVTDDRALWLATLTAHERDMADKRGSSPDFWWQTGRRYATEFGVTYRFRRVNREEPEYRLILAYDLAECGQPGSRQSA